MAGSRRVRIEANSRAGVAGTRSASARDASGEVFRPDTGQPAPRAATASGPAATAAVASLLALQSVEDPLLARRKAVRRGQSLLDTLEEMRAELVVGRVPEGRLNRLVALLGQAREAAEPGLDALIDDIELRARVELAKLGRFPA